jgi:hypothetical protein
LTQTVSPPGPAVDPKRGRRAFVRVVLVLVVASLLAMWVYVLFIGKEKFPNHIEDLRWRASAERVCAGIAGQVAALPPAASFAHIRPKEEALRQRADVGQEVNDLLARQLAELRALPPPTSRNDQLLVQAWFDDWKIYLSDRQAHVESWRQGHDEQFAESMASGGPISDRMDDLSNQNRMDDCVVPNDFG